MPKLKKDRWLLILTIASFVAAGVALVAFVAVAILVPGAETERPTASEKRVEQLETLVEELTVGLEADLERVTIPPFVAPRPEDDPYVQYVEAAIARTKRGLEYHKGERR
jgi:hypothetical protein